MDFEDPEPDGEGVQPYVAFRENDEDADGHLGGWYIVLLGTVLSGPYESEEAAWPDLKRLTQPRFKGPKPTDLIMGARAGEHPLST